MITSICICFYPHYVIGGINTSYGVKIETHGQEGPLVFGDQSDHLLRAQPSLGFEKSNTLARLENLLVKTPVSNGYAISIITD